MLAVLDQVGRVAADGIGGFDGGGAEVGFGGVDDVFDLGIDDGTDDEVTARLGRDASSYLGGDTVGGFVPDLHVFAKAILGEKTGSQAVVKVVAVVGDFVGEVGDLGL